MGRIRTVFIDRDGVINVNRPEHVTSWDHFEFIPGALAGLALLARHEHQVVVVTNQAIVNRGLISHGEITQIHQRMRAVIHQHGGRVDGVFACPHRPDEGCGCRKPAPGLIHQAVARSNIRLDEAILIGDHVNDLEAARRAGCRSILVLSGRTSQSRPVETPEGCVGVFPDLLTAAEQLVTHPLPWSS